MAMLKMTSAWPQAMRRKLQGVIALRGSATGFMCCRHDSRKWDGRRELAEQRWRFSYARYEPAMSLL